MVLMGRPALCATEQTPLQCQTPSSWGLLGHLLGAGMLGGRRHGFDGKSGSSGAAWSGSHSSSSSSSPSRYPAAQWASNSDLGLNHSDVSLCRWPDPISGVSGSGQGPRICMLPSAQVMLTVQEAPSESLWFSSVAVQEITQGAFQTVSRPLPQPRSVSLE